MEPLPNINRIFSLIIQQERHMMNKGNVMMNSKALFNSSDNQGNWKMFRSRNGRSQGRGKNKYQNNGKQCTHCHRLNHTVEECYFKYGFPQYKQKGEKNERVTNNVVMDRNINDEEEQEDKSDS